MRGCYPPPSALGELCWARSLSLAPVGRVGGLSGKVGCLLPSCGGALSLGWAAAGALRRAVAGVGLLRGAGGAEGDSQGQDGDCGLAVCLYLRLPVRGVDAVLELNGSIRG